MSACSQPASNTGRFSVPTTSCVASPELPGEVCRGPGLAGESGFPEEVPESQLWALTPPICLTWEVTQGPEQVEDVRLGLGFKVAAEL